MASTLQVKVLSFYDVVIDFILLDSFDDLENPPKSVVSVVNNRWLSNGFKESVKTAFLLTVYFGILCTWLLCVSRLFLGVIYRGVVSIKSKERIP